MTRAVDRWRHDLEHRDRRHGQEAVLRIAVPDGLLRAARSRDRHTLPDDTPKPQDVLGREGKAWVQRLKSLSRRSGSRVRLSSAQTRISHPFGDTMFVRIRVWLPVLAL